MDIRVPATRDGQTICRNPLTGGQVDMKIDQDAQSEYGQINISAKAKQLDKNRKPIKVVLASNEELISHEKNLQDIADSFGICVWKENSY